MSNFVAKRLRFRNGERLSFLSRPGGLSVHEVTLYLARFRKRGRAVNIIHAVCMIMALLYRELDKAGISLLERLRQGQFLTVPEVNRLADAAQYRVTDLSGEDVDSLSRSSVVDIRKIRMRRKVVADEIKAVDAATQASRIRCPPDIGITKATPNEYLIGTHAEDSCFPSISPSWAFLLLLEPLCSRPGHPPTIKIQPFNASSASSSAICIVLYLPDSAIQ